MECDSDDDYDHVSVYHLSGSEDERDDANRETPGSTPPVRSLRRSDRKTLQCPYENCVKTFNRQARLKEHLRSHTNDRIFKCPHVPCTKDYLRESHLQHHIKSAHSNIRDYECTWEGCDQKFATGTRLRRHLEVHEGRERFRCRDFPGCNETFRKKETLRKHIALVHEGVKPYPCPAIDLKTGVRCTKGFDTAEKLKQHQRVNHDPHRFSCSDCLAHNAAAMAEDTNSEQQLIPAFFATYSALQQHMTEIHPPRCGHCSAPYSTNKELRRHLELEHDIVDIGTYSSKTEFKCTYPDCNKSYSKRGNLNVHVKTSHENRKEFICGQTEIALPEDVAPNITVQGCGSDFTTRASLEEHVRTAHLGLQSKRQMREKKRKANESDDEDETHKKAKPKPPRKDKGVLRKSRVAQLTGMAIDANHAISQNETVEPTEEMEVSDYDSEEDHHGGLSGDVTILGDCVFDQTGQYNYIHGRYPPGLRAPDPDVFGAHHGDSVNNTTIHDDDEGFFDNFEPEPLYFVDPRLLRTMSEINPL